MYLKLHIFIALLLTGCVTTAKPPSIAQINFISMKPAIVQQWTVMGDYHAESFDVPGYNVRFKSNLAIAPEYNGDFINLDYYECNSQERYEDGHVYSARDYIRFSNSWAKLVDQNLEGSFLYEAQLIGEHLSRASLPICAQIFVHDIKTNRKVWQPSFVSNKIVLTYTE